MVASRDSETSVLPHPPLTFAEQTGWISKLRKVLPGSGPWTRFQVGRPEGGEPARVEPLTPSLPLVSAVSAPAALSSPHHRELLLTCHQCQDDSHALSSPPCWQSSLSPSAISLPLLGPPLVPSPNLATPRILPASTPYPPIAVAQDWSLSGKRCV